MGQKKGKSYATSGHVPLMRMYQESTDKKFEEFRPLSALAVEHAFLGKLPVLVSQLSLGQIGSPNSIQARMCDGHEDITKKRNKGRCARNQNAV